MAKKIISVAIAIALTIGMCALLGINITSSLAVIGMAVFYTLIAYKVADDLTDGTKITVCMWIAYAFAVLAVTGYGIGMSLSSVPFLIGMGVCIVGAVICYYLNKNNSGRAR